MPIANCYISHITFSNQQVETLTKEWADIINVDLKDICVSFIDVAVQTGQKYKVKVNLFLPTIWDKSSIKRIQLSFDNLLKKHLKLRNEDVFIITITIQSGNVTENGKIVEWDD